MLLDFGRVMFWIIVSMLVAIFEYSTGLPILTVAVVLITVIGLSTVWFVTFVTVISLLLASLFLQSWLIIWLLLIVGSLLFRLPNSKSRQTLFSKILIVSAASLLIAALREPTVTISFLIHSGISLSVAVYVLWRKIMPKTRGLDVAELRFMAKD
jgi:hypothetical protein